MSFVFTTPPTTQQKRTYNDLIKDSLLEDEYFLRQWQRYVTSPWRDSLQYMAETVVSLKEKDETLDTNSIIAVSLCTIEPTSDEQAKISSGDMMESQPHWLTERKLDEALIKTLQESFDEEEDKQFWKNKNQEASYKNKKYSSAYEEEIYQYIAKIAYLGHDLQAVYEAQMQSDTPKIWKLIFLSSMIAYQAKDAKQLQRMVAHKKAHIAELGETIYNYHLLTVPPELTASMSYVLQQIEHLCNEYVVEIFAQTYATREQLSPLRKKHNMDRYKYEKAFYSALCAYHNADLQPYHIKNIVTQDQNVLEKFQLNPETPKETSQRFIAELCKYNKSDKIFADPSRIHGHKMISMDDAALRAYIESQDMGALQCCAIWHYLFRSTSLMQFSERLDTYADFFLKYKKRVEEVEDKLQAKYSFVSFSHAFAYLQEALLREIIQSNMEEIETLMAYVDKEPDPDMPGSYYQEYDLYKTIYESLLQAQSGERITRNDFFSIGETFRDIVDLYDGDDEEDFDDEDGEEA